ncbi:MAG: 30S ribosomal protein S17 [Planctomycetaceae bacterium]|nr:30S ribosomal protein S17 [Planctomycetaceae bacterium]MBQ2822289.1 30S ribosomal protein S17 [Thermoguttaceae bacterium]
MPKRVAVGVVTSDKMDKTRRVEISRLEKHEKYGKFIRRKTVCTVHDENNESRLGDTVKIEECPPKSKMKRWTLLSVEQKSRLVDVNAMRANAEAAKK